MKAEGKQNDIVSMQDGTPPLVAKSVSRVLEQDFGNRTISRHFPFPCPHRASARSDSYGCLVLEIYQIENQHVQSTNFVGFKRYYKA